MDDESRKPIRSSQSRVPALGKNDTPVQRDGIERESMVAFRGQTLQLVNSSCLLERRNTPDGRGEEAGGQGLCMPGSERRGSPVEQPLHLKTSAAPLCSLSPGRRAAEPGHGAPQPAWHGGGEYGSWSHGQDDMVTIPDLLPSPFSSCTDTTTLLHISHCCLSH
ncbi:hypothetical protein INR49_026053 [Caranx melampygus]|nr:hypothetical protein INR49_026053 [Caranx melampygus]